MNDEVGNIAEKDMVDDIVRVRGFVVNERGVDCTWGTCFADVTEVDVDDCGMSGPRIMP